MRVDSVPLAAAVPRRLAQLGISLPRVLARAQLSASRFAAGRVRLTTREFFAFWSAVEASTEDRGFGLRLGADATWHQLDVASIAALHSQDLGAALAKRARYKRLTCPEELRVELVGDEARVAFHWLLAEQAPPPFLIDGAFASCLALARRGTGTELVPRRVELTRRKQDVALLRAHFGCALRFDAPVDLLVFAADALTLPFVTHNEELVAALVPGLEAELAAATGSASLVDEIRQAIATRLRGERPGVEKIARALGLSVRTLQRRLGEEGTSFQRLLDDARRQVARRLLAETDLEAGEIAFYLGFEELNSFTRAFHAWEGTTPTRWRAQDRRPRLSRPRRAGAAAGARRAR